MSYAKSNVFYDAGEYSTLIESINGDFPATIDATEQIDNYKSKNVLLTYINDEFIIVSKKEFEEFRQSNPTTNEVSMHKVYGSWVVYTSLSCLLNNGIEKWPEETTLPV